MRLNKLITTCLSLILLVPSLTQAKEIKLLTSIKPIQLIAAAIQEGISTPDVLLPVGASAHHYSLRPDDIQKIQNADLFYWVGPDMEIFLTKTVTSQNNNATAIQKLPNIKLRHFSKNEKDHDEHDHEHQAGQIDPHLWLSPENANIIATRMAEDLSKLDPENKEHYQHNLQVFQTELNAIDRAIRDELEKVTLVPFFVSHETYDYFEDAYGVKHTGVFSLNNNVQPGVRQVAEMQERLKNIGNSCIFYEPPIKPKLIDTLTNNLPVNSYELDAMGAEIPMTSKGYPALLNKLAKQLLQCKK